MPITLGPGVSFCQISDRLVFLDLEQDRYFGSPASVLSTDPNSPAFRTLLKRGLLVGDGDICASVAAFRCEPASSDLIDLAPATAVGAVRAFCAQLTAAARLRHQGLSHALDHARRAQIPCRMTASGSASTYGIILAGFRTIAPLFTQERACLTRSLALMDVLAGAPPLPRW